VFWVDLRKVDFKEGSGARKVPIETGKGLAGEISGKFEPAKPFKWLTTK
jgi:hypothetical protein